MKKLFFVVFVTLLSLSTILGQELSLTKKYAGMLYAGQFANDMKMSHYTDIRIAGEMQLNMNSTTSLFFRGVYSSSGSHFGQFWIEEKNFITFRFGYMARPITFLNRPMPISAGAHFEPPALASVPGSSFGALALKDFNGFSIYGGVYTRNSDPEANLGFKFTFLGTEFKAGGFLNLINTQQSKGIAGGFKNPIGQVMVYYESVKTTSFFWTCNLEDIIEPYITIVYDRVKSNPSASEFGFTKTMKIINQYTNGLSGLVGLGYNSSNGTINAYIWMYIE